MKIRIPIAVLVLIASCYLLQMFFGVNISMRGLMMPQIIDDFRISYTSGGLMFLLPVIPLIAGSLITGYLFSHYNKKGLALAGIGIMALSMLVMTFSPVYSIYLVCTLIAAFGTMVIFIVSNITVTEFFHTYARKYRSNGIILIHFFFGIGAISSMTVGNLILTDESSWRIVFRTMAAILFGIGILFAFARFIRAEGPVVSPHPSQLVRVLARPRMLLYGLAAMCYVGTEFAVVNWAPTFMEKGLGEPKSYSSLVMMLFFVCFTGGRLLASVVIHRLNQTATFTILCAGGILAMAAAFIFQIRIMGFDLFIPVTGFFLSAIFPILQNHVIHDFEGQMSLATGALYASSNIGASVMPFLIGALNDLFGVKGGIAVTGGILLLCLSAFLGAQYITHVKITEAEG